MNDLGYDLADATREPLKQEMLSNYDKVISMESVERTPDWLLKAPNYIYWDVKDPRGQDYETTARVRDDILGRVRRLIENEK